MNRSRLDSCSGHVQHQMMASKLSSQIFHDEAYRENNLEAKLEYGNTLLGFEILSSIMNIRWF